jgi:hypothetical protein
LLALSLGGLACQAQPPVQTRAEKAILQRQVAELERVVRAGAPTGAVIPLDQAVLAIDQSLIEDLLDAALPYERVVAERFRINVRDAAVTCEDGLALVRLSGRASFADQPEAYAYAEVTVYGALREFTLEPADSVLRSRVDLISFVVPQVRVLGTNTETGRGLVRDLARLRLEVFEGLDYAVDIPVRLQDVRLPELESSNVRIPSETIPLQIAVTDVNALRGRLWISLRLQQALVSASTQIDSTEATR